MSIEFNARLKITVRYIKINNYLFLRKTMLRYSKIVKYIEIKSIIILTMWYLNKEITT